MNALSLSGGIILAKKKPPVKCPGCEERFYREDEEYVHLKNRYWHKECYLEKQKVIEDKYQLEEYICELFDLNFVSPRIQKQINTYIENYNFTYSGILGSLKYWFDIKEESVEKANGGIGIVPYIYNDAKNYFYKAYQAQQNINQSTKIIKGQYTVKIPPQKRRVKQIKEINLDFLEGNEE